MNDIVNFIIQIIVAVVIVYIIQVIITKIFLSKPEDDVDINKMKSKDYSIKFIEGIIPIKSSEVFVSTNNTNDINYVYIPKSVNKYNGAEFSFSFWINKGQDQSLFINKPILLFGLKNKEKLITKHVAEIDSNILLLNQASIDNKYTKIIEPKYENTKINYPKGDNTANYRIFDAEIENDILVKCPLIRFDEDGTSIIVELNTNQNVHNKFIIKNKVLEILNRDAWNLLTFSFEDFRDFTGFATGIKMTFYMNDKEISTQIIKNDSIKINDGYIYVLPDIKYSNVIVPKVEEIDMDKKVSIPSMADFTYYNRSIKVTDIRKIASKGFTDSIFKTPRMKNNNDVIKRYNEINLYNETYDL